MAIESLSCSKSRAIGFSLKSKVHVLNLTLHRFKLAGTDD